MAGGTENGVELGRAHFVKHEGGAAQVELGGVGSLHCFTTMRSSRERATLGWEMDRGQGHLWGWCTRSPFAIHVH